MFMNRRNISKTKINNKPWENNQHLHMKIIELGISSEYNLPGSPYINLNFVDEITSNKFLFSFFDFQNFYSNDIYHFCQSFSKVKFFMKLCLRSQKILWRAQDVCEFLSSEMTHSIRPQAEFLSKYISHYCYDSPILVTSQQT